MNDDSLVLGAMLRLARRRVEANVNELFERVQMDPSRIRASLGRLDAAGLIERRTTGARLTLSGLATAVALRPARARAALRDAKLKSHAA
jgi:Mn-dependent DtxR family transcriptional regulator